jgi:hypothetical protein
MNQIDKLIHHFKTAGTITNVEAQGVYKIRALPRRISDLEDRGYKFNRVRKTDLTGQRYTRYSLDVEHTSSNFVGAA